MNTALRSIDFHGKQVPVLIREDGEWFVPMRPRVEAMGLDWSSQAAKFRSNPKKWGVAMIPTPTVSGTQNVACLPLRKLDVWLLNLEPSRVKPEFREELEREQEELSEVLWAYRLAGAAIRPEVRAAAPEATQALFEEIEAMTGLNPEAAQPGRPEAGPALQDWQVEREEARAAVLAYLLAQAEGERSLEAAIAALVEAADQGTLPDDLLDNIRKANARAGEGGRTVSRRTLQRWLASLRQGGSLAPKAPVRPDPAWLEDLLAEIAHAPSLAEAHRRLLERRNEGPSYDAVRRALERLRARAGSPLAPLAAPRDLAPANAVAELFRQARLLFGNREGRAVVLDLLPTLSRLEGGTR